MSQVEEVHEHGGNHVAGLTRLFAGTPKIGPPDTHDDEGTVLWLCGEFMDPWCTSERRDARRHHAIPQGTPLDVEVFDIGILVADRSSPPRCCQFAFRVDRVEPRPRETCGQ